MDKKIKVADLPVFDAVDYLKTEQDCAEYLSVVLEDGDKSTQQADIAAAQALAATLEPEEGEKKE